MVVGAAMASVSAESGDQASPETTADIPAIRDLRLDAAEGVSRGRSGTQPAGFDDTEEAADAASPNERPSPARNPVPTQDATVTAAPEWAAYDRVPGCDAEVPDDGEIANGYLTDDHLCEIGHGHKLRPDAAASFIALADEYAAQGGRSLPDCVTDSYRSYQQQVSLKVRKPYLAAEPGTSNHGWGVAVDLACGVGSYESALYEWLTENGDEFGWRNPAWAQASGAKPEPWHWEYSG